MGQEFINFGKESYRSLCRESKKFKKRISSYIPSVKQSNRIKTLISLTHEISFIKTPNELDSFILENNLIKSLKPRFNIRLMDDKSYPFIMISKSNEWPRIKKKNVVNKIVKIFILDHLLM